MKVLRDLLQGPWVVFGAALLLHVALILALGRYRQPVWVEDGGIATFIYQGKGFAYWPKSEQRFYAAESKTKAAEQVARGGVIPFSELHPTSIHAPGYPCFMAFFWRMFGFGPRGHLAISLIQALLISSIVFPVGWLAARWFGWGAAVCAMWITGLMPLYAYYAASFFSVAIFIVLHPWLLVVWLKVKDNTSAAWAVMAGVLTGGAALFQPSLLAIFGCLGLAMIVGAAARKQWRGAALHLLTALAVLLALAPWTLRNYRVHGEFVLIRSGAGPFWVGNNPNANGTSVVAGGQDDIYAVLPPGCITRGTELTEAQYHRAMLQESWEYIGKAPGAFVTRTLKKILWYWTWVPRQYINRTVGSAAGQFRSLQIALWIGGIALALIGRLRGGRFPAEYRALLWIYILAPSLLYGLTHVGQARFRGEIEYIFIPAAAEGLAVVARWARAVWERTRRHG